MTARLRIGCSTTELLWQGPDKPITEGAESGAIKKTDGAPSAAPRSYDVHALARIRTATPFGTTPSRWRVYQFHHQGNVLHTPTYGSDGARTRDLSSDSRVL